MALEQTSVPTKGNDTQDKAYRDIVLDCDASQCI